MNGYTIVWKKLALIYKIFLILVVLVMAWLLGSKIQQLIQDRKQPVTLTSPIPLPIDTANQQPTQGVSQAPSASSSQNAVQAPQSNAAVSNPTNPTKPLLVVPNPVPGVLNGLTTR